MDYKQLKYSLKLFNDPFYPHYIKMFEDKETGCHLKYNLRLNELGVERTIACFKRGRAGFLLNVDDIRYLEEIENELKSILDKNYFSSVTATKIFVNDLYLNKSIFKELAILNGHFGPVPALIFGKAFLESKEYDAAIFLNLPKVPYSHKKANINSFESNQRENWLYSYEIKFPLMFREYLEDSVAHLFHIYNNCPQQYATNQCRRIRGILDGSVIDKVKHILSCYKGDDKIINKIKDLYKSKSLESKRSPNEIQVANRIVNNYRDELIRIIFYREFIMYLVNRIYRILNVSDLIEERYLVRLKNIFNLEKDERDGALTHPKFLIYEKLLDWIEGRTKEIPKDIFQIETLDWEKKLIDAGLFVGHLESESKNIKNKSCLKFFINYKSDTLGSEYKVEKVGNKLHELINPKIYISRFPKDSELYDQIRARIYLSDVILSCTPLSYPPMEIECNMGKYKKENLEKSIKKKENTDSFIDELFIAKSYGKRIIFLPYSVDDITILKAIKNHSMIESRFPHIEKIQNGIDKFKKKIEDDYYKEPRIEITFKSEEDQKTGMIFKDLSDESYENLKHIVKCAILEKCQKLVNIIRYSFDSINWSIFKEIYILGPNGEEIGIEDYKWKEKDTPKYFLKKEYEERLKVFREGKFSLKINENKFAIIERSNHKVVSNLRKIIKEFIGEASIAMVNETDLWNVVDNTILKLK